MWQDKAAFRALIAVCFAIAAVGLDPHILDPGMPTVRAAIREDEGIRSVLMLSAVMQAGFLLLGGLIAVRILAWAADGVVLPFAIGAVAMSYGRAARVTALGAAYGVYGAATAVAPALALANGPQASPWPAFVVCAIVASIAVLSSRRMPDLPGADPRHHPTMRAVALFSFGVVSIVAALIQVGGGLDAIRLGTLIAAVISVALSCVPRVRSADGLRTMVVDLRPVAIALAVGVVIGFAQAAPMLQLPQFFQAVQGAPSMVATIAIAPFVIALLVSGPVSGYLLQRIGPRTLLAGGAIAVGLANIIIAIVLDPSTGYPYFIQPFLLIGAGFVIATTVRTAIIFASVPRDLPASAAALNEASIGMAAGSASWSPWSSRPIPRSPLPGQPGRRGGLGHRREGGGDGVHPQPGRAQGQRHPSRQRRAEHARDLQGRGRGWDAAGVAGPGRRGAHHGGHRVHRHGSAGPRAQRLGSRG